MAARKGPPKGTGGRPPKAPEDRRVYRTMRLAPETDASITSARRPGESYSATIDRLVQGSSTMTETHLPAEIISESEIIEMRDVLAYTGTFDEGGMDVLNRMLHEIQRLKQEIITQRIALWEQAATDNTQPPGGWE